LRFGWKLATAGILALASAFAYKGCNMSNENYSLNYINEHQQKRLEEIRAKHEEKIREMEFLQSMEEVYYNGLPAVMHAANIALDAAKLKNVREYDHEMSIGSSDIHVKGGYWADDDVADFDLATEVRMPGYTFTFTYDADSYSMFSGSSSPGRNGFVVKLEPNGDNDKDVAIDFTSERAPQQFVFERTYDTESLFNGIRRVVRHISDRDIKNSPDTGERRVPATVIWPGPEMFAYFCFDDRNWWRDGSSELIHAASGNEDDMRRCERDYALDESEIGLGNLVQKMGQMRETARIAYRNQN